MKIRVPDGMLRAALGAVNDRRTVHCDRCNLRELNGILAAALGWLAQNPIPAGKQFRDDFERKWQKNIFNIDTFVSIVCAEWQHRMFVEEEVLPPELIQCLWEEEEDNSTNDWFRFFKGQSLPDVVERHNEQVRRAYEIGKRAK